MSIEQNWKQLDKQQDEDLSSLLRNFDPSKPAFRHPLEHIRNRMRLGMMILLIFLCAFTVILVLYPAWPLNLGLCVMISYILWGIFSYWRLYDRISNTLIAPRSLLDEMRRHYRTLVSQRKMSIRLGLILWPVSVVTGEMFGHLLGSDEPLVVYMQKTSSLIEWAVGVVILVPISYFLTKSLTKGIYQRDLEALQRNIRELEGVPGRAVVTAEL